MTFSYLLDIYLIVDNVSFTLNATFKSWRIGICLVLPGNFGKSPGWNDWNDMTDMTRLTCQFWHDMKWLGMTWLTCHVAASLAVDLVWLDLSFPSSGRNLEELPGENKHFNCQIGANSKLKKLLLSGYFRIA